MTDSVRIDFRKWPDVVHWQFEMERLGEDEHGTWLWSPPGTEFRRGDEPPKQARFLNIKLITHDHWWTAIWNDRSTDHVRLYVDIATPARWNGSRVTMIDLDLDVGLHPDGSIEIFDEDEFAEHQITLGYPPDLVDRARAATAAVYLDIERGRPPFDGTADQWMLQAREVAAER